MKPFSNGFLHAKLYDLPGLNSPISRRDFLNGVLLTGAGLLIHNKPNLSREASPSIRRSTTSGPRPGSKRARRRMSS